MSRTLSHLRHTQNFLRSRTLVDRLVANSSISPDDLVYDIGPGRGIITAALAGRCGRVVAVEKDGILAAYLRQRFAGNPRVVIHAADFLCVPLPRTTYKVFASIPFNATAAIIDRLITSSCPPEDSYLVVQREAAWRFLGRPAESLVALLLKPWFEPSMVYGFQRRDFDPAPQVESVLLRLRKRGPPLVARAEAQAYRDLVAYAFTAWRPTLYDALYPLVGQRRCMQLWHSMQLCRSATPTSISFDQWLVLFRQLRVLESVHLWRTIAGAERRLRRQQATLRKVHRTRVSSSPPGERAGVV